MTDTRFASLRGPARRYLDELEEMDELDAYTSGTWDRELEDLEDLDALGEVATPHDGWSEIRPLSERWADRRVDRPPA